MATAKNTITETTREKLITLYTLQYSATQLDEINKMQGELPMEVKDMEDEIAGLSKRKERFQTQIENFEAEINKHKENIITSNSAIEKYKVQLDNVKNNREFEALSKEIEYQSLEAQLSEKKIRGLEEKLEKVKELAEGIDESITAKNEHLEKKKVELEAIVQKNEKKVGTLERKLIRLSKKVEPRLLKGFNALRNRYVNGLAVVTIERKACGGCYNTVPPQIKIEVAQDKEIIACENCGRVLISDEIATEVDKKDRTVIVEEKPKRRTRRTKVGK